MILYLGNKLTAHGNTPTSVETLGSKFVEFGFTTVTKSSVQFPLLRLADMLWSVFKYRKKNPVVLIDTYSTSAFWFAWTSAILCRLFNLAYIPILRGGDLSNRIKRSPGPSSSLFKNSFTNIAVSGYLEAVFKNNGLPVEMIHNYINLDLYKPKIRKQIQPRLLWVRSFHEIYNPEMAILVLKSITEKYPEATLCMVGPDKDGSMIKCKNLAKESNLHVTFTGRLSKPEWTKLSENYDIFINTTNIDNTPVSVMEAMALGMPVVTTNAGGIPWLFKDNVEGIMVDVNNSNEMHRAILSLLSDIDRAENISIAARRKAEEWDWKLVGPQWKLLIERAGQTYRKK